MKTRLFALLLALLCLTGCGKAPESLTEGLKPRSSPLEEIPEEDAAALTDFSLTLLRQTWKGENALLSPLSVLAALGMAANGARGETLAQMETVLGLSVEELNAVLAAWTAGLAREEEVSLANSLWFRDNGSLQVNPDFLEAAAGWYGAEVFPSPLDASALREINGWVKENTHGMIPEILDEIPEEAVMYLINALALEAEWETVYREDQVWENRIFTTEEGREQPIELMYSSEGYYLKGSRGQGFLKPYRGGRWAFAALLPEEGLGLAEYAASLTGEALYGMLANAEATQVYAAIPKFQCAYGADLAEGLKALGMTDAFDLGRADFSGMGTSSQGPLLISRVLHRTYLAVDERGTRAGAATAVEADAGGAAPGVVPEVYLNRPFLYMLVDRETNLPAFIGVVTDMS